ncbi:MAG: hypothetical protein ACRDP1_02130 [Nocardioidaceae bacterium]
MTHNPIEREPGDLAGVDGSDTAEALRHDPDDSMERAGDSHWTRDELGEPAATDTAEMDTIDVDTRE